MSNLNQTDLAIRISKGSNLDANGLYVASDYRFLDELKSAITVLTEAGFVDVEPTIGRYEPREDTDITTYVEISPWHLSINTAFYDEDGNLDGEEEGSYDISDFEEHLKIFNSIKALFDPTPHPLLASAWDQVATIRIDRDELIFEIGLPDVEDDQTEIDDNQGIEMEKLIADHELYSFFRDAMPDSTNQEIALSMADFLEQVPPKEPLSEEGKINMKKWIKELREYGGVVLH